MFANDNFLSLDIVICALSTETVDKKGVDICYIVLKSYLRVKEEK